MTWSTGPSVQLILYLSEIAWAEHSLETPLHHYSYSWLGKTISREWSSLTPGSPCTLAAVNGKILRDLQESTLWRQQKKSGSVLNLEIILKRLNQMVEKTNGDNQTESIESWSVKLDSVLMKTENSRKYIMTSKSLLNWLMGDHSGFVIVLLPSGHHSCLDSQHAPKSTNCVRSSISPSQ